VLLMGHPCCAWCLEVERKWAEGIGTNKRYGGGGSGLGKGVRGGGVQAILGCHCQPALRFFFRPRRALGRVDVCSRGGARVLKCAVGLRGGCRYRAAAVSATEASAAAASEEAERAKLRQVRGGGGRGRG
jgi:hypothetical protein